MAAAFLWDFGQAGNPRNGFELVYHHGIIDVGGDAERDGDGLRHRAANVGDVDVHSLRKHVINHVLRNGVSARRTGREHAAARHDAGERFKGNPMPRERLLHAGPAVIKLIHHPMETGKLRLRMIHGLAQQSGRIVVNGDLRGSRAGVDDKNPLHRHLSMRLPRWQANYIFLLRLRRVRSAQSVLLRQESGPP